MNTRKVEVIRVGSINLDIDYPAKQIIRLRDVSGLYEGGALAGLADAKKKIEAFKRGQRKKITEDQSIHVYDQRQLEPALKGLSSSVSDLYDRLRGKRLANINVEVWDQISGAYLGATNTDENGTLVLPTDKKFVEVLQWKIAGGGYSDCFNGEPAAGMPGLFFYFPCNEGKGMTIKSFPGVSGQLATLADGSRWYDSGFFNRPAIDGGITAYGAMPQGRRSFQFLWYCNDPTTDYQIFGYSTMGIGMPTDFMLQVSGGRLRGMLADGTPSDPGVTELQAGKWYLVQINTEMMTSVTALYSLEMSVYLGGAPELSVSSGNIPEENVTQNPMVSLSGASGDASDELRHLDRELYPSEIADYAEFLKNGRVSSKSEGALGSPGW